MKRWIHAVTEPSSVEYGEAISRAKKRLAERYEPFVVKPCYFSSSSVNSTGYRITLPDQEWVADKKAGFYGGYTLYGPFNPNQIQGWGSQLDSKKIADFKELDNAMTYLFENVDLDDYYEE